MTRRKLIAALVALVVAAGALTLYLLTRPGPASVRHEVTADGVYRPGSLHDEVAVDAVCDALREPVQLLDDVVEGAGIDHGIDRS